MIIHIICVGCRSDDSGGGARYLETCVVVFYLPIGLYQHAAFSFQCCRHSFLSHTVHHGYQCMAFGTD